MKLSFIHTQNFSIKRKVNANIVRDQYEKKTLLSWSCGKDSAWALHAMRQDPNIDVVGLVCTVNQEFDRVAIHGIRKELLELQVQNLDLPLYQVLIPYPCNIEVYENEMKAFINEAVSSGIEYIAFGDLFLQNVREYREKLLADSGIKPLFPIWAISTQLLSSQMISSGLRAIITCVDSKYLQQEFSSREYNQSFLDDLPKNVDLCSENGEFHSFTIAGPMFKKAIDVDVGETIYRQGIYFTDIHKQQS